MLAPFVKASGAGSPGGSHGANAAGSDNTHNTLLGAGPGTAAAAGAAAGAAAAAAASSDKRSQQSQPPMRQEGDFRPLVPVAAASRNSNRMSTFTGYSAVSSAFTPSPVSPISPASMLSPGVVYTGRPRYEPGDPRIIPAADARLSRGSFSSISTGSGVSAALSPGQMPWPMPPSTPSLNQPNTPGSAQGADREYINFQESGETVVKINQPPRSRR